jgi:hypothetical protein
VSRVGKPVPLFCSMNCGRVSIHWDACKTPCANRSGQSPTLPIRPWGPPSPAGWRIGRDGYRSWRVGNVGGVPGRTAYTIVQSPGVAQGWYAPPLQGFEIHCPRRPQSPAPRPTMGEPAAATLEPAVPARPFAIRPSPHPYPAERQAFAFTKKSLSLLTRPQIALLTEIQA